MARGFSDGTGFPLVPSPDTERQARPDPVRPFASTGPHGHRGRMRDRLLGAGPDGFADYELLEMLLYFGISRGDTKPLAKAAINALGSLAEVLTAPEESLRNAGLNADCAASIRLVEAAAARLAQAEAVSRPVLSNWDQLIAHLQSEFGGSAIQQHRVLFLDNRNRLIADEFRQTGPAQELEQRQIMQQALELHATALILVHHLPDGNLTPSKPAVQACRQLKRAGSLLSVTLHDYLLIGGGDWLSFAQLGLL